MEWEKQSLGDLRAGRSSRSRDKKADVGGGTRDIPGKRHQI